MTADALLKKVRELGQVAGSGTAITQAEYEIKQAAEAKRQRKREKAQRETSTMGLHNTGHVPPVPSQIP